MYAMRRWWSDTTRYVSTLSSAQLTHSTYIDNSKRCWIHIKLDNGIRNKIHILIYTYANCNVALTCFNMPTSNSSTLCWIPLDVSINFASMDLANALPSAIGITRERAKSALLPTRITDFSFVRFSRHKYFTMSSAWRNDERWTTE